MRMKHYDHDGRARFITFVVLRIDVDLELRTQMLEQ